MIIDSHCHLQFKAYDNDREEVIQKCLEKGMLLNIVGTQNDTSKEAVELALKYDNFYATIGIHPIQHSKVEVKEEGDSFVSREEQFNESFFDELVQSGKVIGIGETGLDAFHIPDGKLGKEAFEKQKTLFLQHLHFAEKHNLPLVIHVRDAHTEMIELLKSVKQPIKGVLHCFTGNTEQAKAYLDLGLYIGLGGVVTFPPKKLDPEPQEELFKAIDMIPLDKILTETDAPYLAPQAYRGERCEPWMTEEVVKFIAKRRKMGESELEGVIEQNFRKLFHV
ncbi:MAG: TatD family hydrolase [Candidatus Magasanikbacteria bacterium]